MVSKNHTLSVRRQCKLLTLTRSNLYYEPKGESVESLRFMEIIDEQFLETPMDRANLSGHFLRKYPVGQRMARFMKRNDHASRAAGKTDARSQWIGRMRERRHPNVVAVALANKNARIIWSLLSKDQEYRQLMRRHSAENHIDRLT